MKNVIPAGREAQASTALQLPSVKFGINIYASKQIDNLIINFNTLQQYKKILLLLK